MFMFGIKALSIAALAAVVTVTTAAAPAAATYTSRKFEGAKANTGTVTATVDGGRITLQVSDDFVIPDTPAPSWQVVDSKGNTYLLNQMKIKGGTNRTITLPAYIKDVAKVQVWCSWAEALLGEAPFEKVVK
jgi:hypothetical protein